MIPMTESLEAHVTDERGQFFLKLITHSARHLEVVIEDALEMTRLENNTFEVNKDWFDVRQTISDIVESMNFQSSMKGFPTLFEASDDFPE